MNFLSTHNSQLLLPFEEAIFRSLAPDGGRLLPAELPEFSALQTALSANSGKFSERLARILAELAPELSRARWQAVCETAFAPEHFPERQYRATPLNPYVNEELLLTLDDGPSGFREDYSEAFAHAFWLLEGGERRPFFLSSGSFAAALSLAAIQADSQLGQTGEAFYLLLNPASELEESLLDALLHGGRSEGVVIRGKDGKALLDLADLRETILLSNSLTDPGKTLFCSTESPLDLLLQLALLLLAVADLQSQEILSEAGEIDLYLPPSALDLALAALYAKGMGAPLGRIVFCEIRSRLLHELLRAGRLDLSRCSGRPYASAYQLPLDGLEALLFELLGRNDELRQKLLDELREKGSFTVSRLLRDSWNQHLRVLSVEEKSLRHSLRSIYDRSDYLLDPQAAAALAERSPRRGKAPAGKTALILCASSPIYAGDMAAEALFGRSRGGTATPGNVMQRLSQESGVAIPPVLLAADAQIPGEDSRVVFQHVVPENAAETVRALFSHY